MSAVLSILSFDKTALEHAEGLSLTEALAQVREDRITWIMASGITLQDDHAVLADLLAHFRLNPALQESFLKAEQQPFEGERDDCLYSEYTLLLYRPTLRAHARVAGAIVLGRNFVLLLEKTPSGVFDKLRRKIIGRHTRIQQHGADYLFSLLIRAIIANYQDIHRAIEAKFEVLEDDVIGHPGRDVGYERALELREEYAPLYSYLVDLNDFVKAVRDDETRFVGAEAKRLFSRTLSREVEALLVDQQHLRSWLAELIEIHRANVNDSTNRVMKTLTVISTIFLPLTFIAGVYGMNFVHMPELKWAWAYPAVMAFMLALAVGALAYMRSKRWL